MSKVTTTMTWWYEEGGENLSKGHVPGTVRRGGREKGDSEFFSTYFAWKLAFSLCPGVYMNQGACLTRFLPRHGEMFEDSQRRHERAIQPAQQPVRAWFCLHQPPVVSHPSTWGGGSEGL